jgi:hypothetical protein
VIVIETLLTASDSAGKNGMGIENTNMDKKID